MGEVVGEKQTGSRLNSESFREPGHLSENVGSALTFCTFLKLWISA